MSTNTTTIDDAAEQLTRAYEDRRTAAVEVADLVRENFGAFKRFLRAQPGLFGPLESLVEQYDQAVRAHHAASQAMHDASVQHAQRR